VDWKNCQMFRVNLLKQQQLLHSMFMGNEKIMTLFQSVSHFQVTTVEQCLEGQHVPPQLMFLQN
jgi:hypothetical protein